MAEEQPPGAEGSSEDPDGSDGPSPADDLGAATGDAASKRRLCRSSTDKVIAGVAGGIGAYFGIDLVIVRIAFIVLTFLGGAGPFLYLIGWLALPPRGWSQRDRQRRWGETRSVDSAAWRPWC